MHSEDLKPLVSVALMAAMFSYLAKHVCRCDSYLLVILKLSTPLLSAPFSIASSTQRRYTVYISGLYIIGDDLVGRYDHYPTFNSDKHCCKRKMPIRYDKGCELILTSKIRYNILKKLHESKPIKNSLKNEFLHLHF